MNEPTRPTPVPDQDSAPFWEGCRNHKLRIQKCANCGTLRFPARRHCAACGSDQSTWTDASGKGNVYSWIVVNHPVPREVFVSEVPYVVALVNLEEGVRMPTNIVGIPPDQIKADMPVEVLFTEVDGVVLPKFRPRAE